MEASADRKIEFFKGDRVLWITIIVISVMSILPVYSASSNLEHIVNAGSTTLHTVKHMLFILLGLALMRFIGAVKYEHIGKLSIFLLGFSVVLLFITMFTGQTIQGASGGR